MLKKINAILGLFTILVLIVHIGVGFQTLEGKSLPIGEAMPVVTMVLVIAHGVLSMLIMTLVHEGNDMRYRKQNASTIVQRVSGILLLVPLFVSHSKIYESAEMQTALYGILEISFFVLVAAHIATSLPKALVTLGALKNEKAHKVVSIVSVVACLALAADGIALAVRTTFL